MARPGTKRDPRNARKPAPNTAKLMKQLVKVARARGCSREYLVGLLDETYAREEQALLRHRSRQVKVEPEPV